MKIGILLSGRYPTDKAYGVTTTATAKCLSQMGHTVYVFGLQSTYSENLEPEDEFAVIHFKESRLTQFLKLQAFSGFGVYSKVSWWIYWKFLRVINKAIIDEFNFDLFWIRNHQMMEFTTGARRVILEIHQDFSIKKLTKRILAESGRKVVIAPISKSLLAKLKKSQIYNKAIFSPMGITLQDIATKEKVLESGA